MNSLVLKVSISIVTILFMMLGIAGLGNAATETWRLQVSTPTFNQQTSTFNLDYSIGSIIPAESFTVRLIANGNTVETQNITTSNYLATSRFVRSNVPEGSYTYIVQAQPNSGGEPKSSEPKTVTVNLPDAQVVVVSRSTDAGQSTTAAVRSNDSASNSTNTGAANQQAVAAVSDAISPITETSSTQAGTNVEGATNNNGRNFTLATLALLAGIGAVLWYGITRYIDNRET